MTKQFSELAAAIAPKTANFSARQTLLEVAPIGRGFRITLSCRPWRAIGAACERSRALFLLSDPTKELTDRLLEDVDKYGVRLKTIDINKKE